ncbi:hypothetical protein MKW94_023655 [Papaver nudicaule]|uniref:Late embryogenesis abundant protein LEA-2 subgroup domain-containing protein n=1 Tax=Papaver nudicaule TaxID=74823 RepID=A0AA41V2E5_PAPNU|nr:hypothetical protein [Papaver nudicaule]
MFLAIVITIILVALITWFGMHPLRPRCTLGKFYIPTLDKASNATQTVNSTAISIELSFWNRNTEKKVYYDKVNMTFSYYYGINGLSIPIGNTSIPPFHQRYLRTKDHVETIQTFGVPWEDVRMKISNGSTPAVFRVDLETHVRFKNGLWKTRRHELRLGANFTVNDHGRMMSTDNGLRLHTIF